MGSSDTNNRIDMKTRTSPFKNRRPSSSSRGFSLVELCLSLGIISVSLMPLLGVLAGSLGQLRTNMDRNQAINISQQILLEAKQMDFAQLKSKGTYTEYFTEEGDNVSANNPQIVYTAIVTVTDPASQSAPLQSGSLTVPAPPSTLVALSVKIRKTPGGVDAPSNSPVATYVNMVSCNDLSTLSASQSPSH